MHTLMKFISIHSQFIAVDKPTIAVFVLSEKSTFLNMAVAESDLDPKSDKCP